MSMSRGFQRAVFSESTAATFLVVATPSADKRIRVRGCFLSAAAAQNVSMESKATQIGSVNLVAGANFVLPPMDGGVGEAWLQCEKGEALNITLGQAQQTDGVIFYDIVGG